MVHAQNYVEQVWKTLKHKLIASMRASGAPAKFWGHCIRNVTRAMRETVGSTSEELPLDLQFPGQKTNVEDEVPFAFGTTGTKADWKKASLKPVMVKSAKSVRVLRGKKKKSKTSQFTTTSVATNLFDIGSDPSAPDWYVFIFETIETWADVNGAGRHGGNQATGFKKVISDAIDLLSDGCHDDLLALLKGLASRDDPIVFVDVAKAVLMHGTIGVLDVEVRKDGYTPSLKSVEAFYQGMNERGETGRKQAIDLVLKAMVAMITSKSTHNHKSVVKAFQMVLFGVHSLMDNNETDPRNYVSEDSRAVEFVDYLIMHYYARHKSKLGDTPDVEAKLCEKTGMTTWKDLQAALGGAGVTVRGVGDDGSPVADGGGAAGDGVVAAPAATTKVDASGSGSVTPGTVLGNGTFGSVVAVVYEGKICAKKTAFGFSKAQRDIATEIDIFLQLGVHTNIVEMIHYDKENRSFYVMQFCSGGSMLSYFEAHNGDVDSNTTLSMLIGVCEGLWFMHSRTIPLPHRDVAMRNVLLHDGIPKLADFGLTRMLDDKAYYMIKANLAVLTASPEALNAAKISTPSDVWQFLF